MILYDTILHNAINPALLLLPRAMDSDAARVQILATGAQESDYNFRAQIVHGRPDEKGPARSFWQIERPSISRLLMNEATRQQVIILCNSRPQKVPVDDVLIHARIEFDDVLAAGMARLIYWADPHPIAGVNDSHQAAWECYFRNWRPGHPRRERWDERRQAARNQVIST